MILLFLNFGFVNFIIIIMFAILSLPLLGIISLIKVYGFLLITHFHDFYEHPIIFKGRLNALFMVKRNAIIKAIIMVIIVAWLIFYLIVGTQHPHYFKHSTINLVSIKIILVQHLYQLTILVMSWKLIIKVYSCRLISWAGWIEILLKVSWSSRGNKGNVF